MRDPGLLMTNAPEYSATLLFRRVKVAVTP